MIYITGHKNPDMDSVCSAYAYANLKNQIDPANEYMAVRCGHLSDSAKKILNYADITPPPYKKDVYPRIADVMLHSDVQIDANASITTLAQTYHFSDPSASPVFENGKFLGLLFVDDITSWVMSEFKKYGKIVNIPKIKDIMHPHKTVAETSELFEDAKELLTLPKFRGVAVFENDEFKGYVTRRCFLEPPRYKVILVDHNEPEQSIPGIETADILEIVDHHRLDALKTDLPIFIDAEPLGSTCTIVYQLYLRNHLMPDENTAKALLTGLLADTLILKSPTTTPTDIETAKELSEICHVDVTAYGEGMFANMEQLGNRDIPSAISSDFKKYDEGGTRFGIGQIEVTTLHGFRDYQAKYYEALEEFRVKNGLDWAMVMITNVMKEYSLLLVTDFRANKHLPYAKKGEHLFDMPNVMSRKKQLLPEVIHAISIHT